MRLNAEMRRELANIRRPVLLPADGDQGVALLGISKWAPLVSSGLEL